VPYSELSRDKDRQFPFAQKAEALYRQMHEDGVDIAVLHMCPNDTVSPTLAAMRPDFTTVMEGSKRRQRLGYGGDRRPAHAIELHQVRRPDEFRERHVRLRRRQ